MKAKTAVRRVMLLVAGLLLMVVPVMAGCNQGLMPEEAETVSSCVVCHTDKDTLKQVASPEPEQAVSEETSGEG
jgi:cytochrome c553